MPTVAQQGHGLAGACLRLGQLAQILQRRGLRQQRLASYPVGHSQALAQFRCLARRRRGVLVAAGLGQERGQHGKGAGHAGLVDSDAVERDRPQRERDRLEVFLLARVRQEWGASGDKHRLGGRWPATQRPDHHRGLRCCWWS
jgi:hypothetical protein